MLHVHTKEGTQFTRMDFILLHLVHKTGLCWKGMGQFCPELRCDVSVECGVASISLSMFQ